MNPLALAYTDKLLWQVCEKILTSDLKEINEHSYLDIDKEISSHPFKKQKDKFVHYLKLEKAFYNAYFNTIKITINEVSNITIRSSIEKVIQSKDPFDKKLEMVRQILRPILDSKFIFTHYDEAVLNELDDINICKSKDQPYCQFTDVGQLLIPDMNLFNGTDNSVLYENRFLDDLIMNVHVQRVMFEEIHSTIYYTDRYNLSDREILLLESLINSYFDKNIPIKNIPSIVHRQFEDVQPNKIFEILNSKSNKEDEQVEPEVNLNEVEDPVEDQVETEVNLNEVDLDEVSVSSDEEENNSETNSDTDTESEESTKSKSESESEESESEESIESETEEITNEQVQSSINKTKKLMNEYKNSPSEDLAKELEKKEKETQNMAKKLYTKNKSPETQGLLVESSKSVTKKIDKPGKEWEKCFVTVYLTDKWKQYFPKGTKTFRINTDNITCNYYMVIQMLKDYKIEYENLDILELKHMLIESYKKYESFRQLILKNWNTEKPGLNKLSNSFEKIIMNETYPLTQIDIVLLMFNYEFPISIINQSKNTVKIVKRVNHHEEYSYYLKVSGKTDFMLFIYDKVTYKIYDISLDKTFRENIPRTILSTYLS